MLTHKFERAIFALPARISMLLLAAMLPAIIRAQPDTVDWRFLGLEGRVVQKLRFHDGYLFATTDDGIFRKALAVDDTLWTPIGLQGKQARALLAFNLDTLLASTEFDTVSLWRTTDGGGNWLPYQNGFGGGIAETVKALERHPHSPDMLFATGATVVAVSPDRGASWQLLHGTWGGFASGTNFVVVDSNNTQIIWAGGQNAIERAFLLKSSDAGDTWREWPQLVEEVSSAKTAAIHPFDSETVYAGLESFILRTSDGGDTWEEKYVEDGRFFFGIAINPIRPQRMYAASWFKTPDPQSLIMFISDDGGDTWDQLIEQTITFGGAWDLLHLSDGATDRLYLGLYKGGVVEFTAELPTSVDPQPPIVSTFRLEQNYPNPANPETMIAFSLPRAGMATLKIYTLLGREVATLVSGELPAGEHRVRWRAGGLPSGVYLYRLETAEQTATRRLLVLK